MLCCHATGETGVLSAGGVAARFLVGHHPHEQHRSGDDPGVGAQAAAHAPLVLVVLGGQAQRAHVGSGDRAAQLMIVLSAIERTAGRFVAGRLASRLQER